MLACFIIGIVLIVLGVVGIAISLIMDNLVSVITLLLSLYVIPQGVLLMLLRLMFGKNKRYSYPTAIFSVCAVVLQTLLAAITAVNLIGWGALGLLIGAVAVSLTANGKKPELIIKLLVIFLATLSAYPLYYLLGGLLI